MASVTYYFNARNNNGSFDEGVGYDTARIVDASLSTCGADNNNGHYVTLTGNECDGTNLGTITSVTVAVLWANNSTLTNIRFSLIPYFGGSSAGDAHEPTGDVGAEGSQDWSDEFDITTDTNAPGSWAWSDVQGLDVRLTTIRGITGQWKPFMARITVNYNAATTYTNTVTANARIFTPGVTKTVTTKASIGIYDNTNEISAIAWVAWIRNNTLEASARICDVGYPTLVSPIQGASEGGTVIFIWNYPPNRWEKDSHFDIEIDQDDDTFANLEFSRDSSFDYAQFEYYDGADWQTVPSAGVPYSKVGNQIRITLEGVSSGTKYWRVRTQVR